MDKDSYRRIKDLIEASGLDIDLESSRFERLEGGSDRLFVRIHTARGSFVCLLQDPGQELESYYSICGFLGANGAPVPEIVAADAATGIILMEDLGDLHLDRALLGASEDETENRYEEALLIIHTLQTRVTQAMLREGFLADRVFSNASLLGETEYFAREFIDDFCKVNLPQEWEGERRALADTLAKEPVVFMHRDFQSRNILLSSGKLRIVDFQTAHRGPSIYDIASLLRDPYHLLPAVMRTRLLRYIYLGLTEAGVRSDSFDEFYERFLLAGIQRNLQALAAFARLGTKKGKKRFLESIPNGLRSLSDGVSEYGKFKGLQKLIGLINDWLASNQRERTD